MSRWWCYPIHSDISLWILWSRQHLSGTGNPIWNAQQSETTTGRIEGGEFEASFILALEASSLVEYCAPAISWNMSVAGGWRWCSFLITLFRSRGSKQTRRLPLTFSTATREEIQSVGSLTGTIMPSRVIRCSFFFNLYLRANGTLCGGFILFTNPSARAGYDTRSIFKQSLTGFNSEFFFS